MDEEVVLCRSRGRYTAVEIIQLTDTLRLVRKEITPKGQGRKTYWSGRIMLAPIWENVRSFSSFTKEGLMNQVSAALADIKKTMEGG